MPTTFLKVEVFYQQHPQLMVREHRKAIAAGHYAGGAKWATDLLPEHFQSGARSEFKYAERNIIYRRRKIRMARLGLVEDGGRTDLVFTGATRRAALRSRYMVKASDKEVTIRLELPRYIQMRPNRYARHALGLEILAMSPRHEKLVTTATERGFNRAISNIRAERRTVIRS